MTLVPELTEATSLASSSTASPSMLVSTRSDLAFSDVAIFLREDETEPFFLPRFAPTPDWDRVMRADPELGSLRLRLMAWFVCSLP